MIDGHSRKCFHYKCISSRTFLHIFPLELHSSEEILLKTADSVSCELSRVMRTLTQERDVADEFLNAILHTNTSFVLWRKNLSLSLSITLFISSSISHLILFGLLCHCSALLDCASLSLHSVIGFYNNREL